MPNIPHILIITPDPKLREELLAAVKSLGERAPVAITADSLRQGVEAARNRVPALVVIEMTADLTGLRAFAAEMQAVVPGTPLAAVLRPELLADEQGESTLLIEGIRAGVRDFLQRPVSSSELAELLARHQDQPSQLQRTSGSVISFISNKGGVGKSTLAVNTAVGLALRHPERVLLIDASLQMGVAASMLDLQPRVTLTDAASERNRLDETMLRQMATPHESGLHLLAAPADAVEAADVDDEILARVITLARRVYDFVVIDTFPLFDRVVVAVLDLSDRTYVVVENVVPTVQGAARMLRVLGGIGFPQERQRVVLNRMTSIAGGLSAEDVAARLNFAIDHVLPYEPRIIAAANMGRPYVMQMGPVRRYFNRFAREFQSLVGSVESIRSRTNEPVGERNGQATPAFNSAEADQALIPFEQEVTHGG